MFSNPIFEKMKKHHCDVAHIYHGATGNNGLYTHEIVKTLTENNVSQEVYVSYFYPFPYGHKYFFKYTDLIANKTSKWWRPYLRFIELNFGLVQTFFSLLKHKPKIINYSLIQTFNVELIFLKAVKLFTKAKLIVTCHDVVPFENRYMSMQKSIKLRKKIFETADLLLVHNPNSIVDLSKYYSVNSDKVTLHLFPLMDLSKLYPVNSNENTYHSDFLFIGHMREEKGILLLLDAWEKYYKKHPEQTLTIAGNNPNNYDFSKYHALNVTIISTYLDDQMYCDLIKNSKFVVLPYSSGTNSGVVSTVLGLGGKVICSDIPMFKNNILIDKKQLFESQSSTSLALKMDECMTNYKSIDSPKTVENYRKRFKQEVSEVYSSLLKNLNK